AQRLGAAALDDTPAIVGRKAREGVRALIDLIRHAVVVGVDDLGRRRDRLGLSDDALTDHLALDRAAPERDRHTEADAPFVHAVVPAGLEVVTHVARFAADSDAAVAELAGQEADADVPNEVRIVFR